MRAIKFVVALTEDGKIAIEGPIDNKVLCYGLLEAAKDAVRKHNDEPRSAIEIPRLDTSGLKL